MKVTLEAGEALELLCCIRSMRAASRKLPHWGEGIHEIDMAITRTVGTSVLLTTALRRAGIDTPFIAMEAVQ